MTEQSSTPPTGGNGNNQRRQNNNRRRHNNNNNNRPANSTAQNNQNPQPPRQASGNPPRPQGQGQNQNNNPNNNPNNNRRRPQPNHNRPRPQGPGSPQGNSTSGFSIERIYEKYLNLLDQHIIARRKYHDLFYRADPAQKNKLERNFYNTLNDIRDFEDKLAPDVRTLFEKRNNGLAPDRIYTSNHELPIEGDEVPKDLAPAEPHLLQSQISADYAEDKEESIGTAEDYLKYKNAY